MNILIIAAHPDDEVLGMGATIKKLSKTNTKYVRSATLVDLIYALILWYFKGYNDIPMSTTWVFVGLLAGRELAFATITEKYKFKTVFPLVT